MELTRSRGYPGRPGEEGYSDAWVVFPRMERIKLIKSRYFIGMPESHVGVDQLHPVVYALDFGGVEAPPCPLIVSPVSTDAGCVDVRVRLLVQSLVEVPEFFVLGPQPPTLLDDIAANFPNIRIPKVERANVPPLQRGTRLIVDAAECEFPMVLQLVRRRADLWDARIYWVGTKFMPKVGKRLVRQLTRTLADGSTHECNASIAELVWTY